MNHHAHFGDTLPLAVGERRAVVIAHGLVKKTRTVPPMAIERAVEMKKRHELMP
jgi:hypothetical protein